MGKFCQILTELSARDRPIFFSFQTIACKYQGILTKLGISIDIKEIWFEIANGQISSMLASCNLSKLSADPDQTLLVWVCTVFQCPSPGFTDNSDVTVKKNNHGYKWWLPKYHTNAGFDFIGQW